MTGSMVSPGLGRATLGIALLVVSSRAAAAEVSPFERERVAASAGLQARRGTAEAIAPLAELVALDEVLPAGAIEGALRAAAGEGSHPLVAVQASFHLARLLDQRGDTAGATAVRASLKMMTRFWVVG